MSGYLDLSSAPSDPVERIWWLGGINEAVKKELDLAYAEAYYTVRLEGRLDSALSLGLHSRKAALALTRAENERRGRSIQRWPDA